MTDITEAARRREEKVFKNHILVAAVSVPGPEIYCNFTV